MLIKKETQKRIEKVVEQLQSGEKRVYYCSMAEVFQKDFWANHIIAESTEKFARGNYDEAVNDVVGEIEKFGELISTEVLAFLFFDLLDLNEFFLAMNIGQICDNYFKEKNFALVPPLDRPYTGIAGQSWSQKMRDFKIAIRVAIKGFPQQLGDYVKETGYQTFAPNYLHRTADEIKQEVEKCRQALGINLPR